MAMPTNFWRKDQLLNIFRTKPCQRLAQHGVCSWKTQCQFSHCIEWPRRSPQRYSYTPELCPDLRATTDANGEQAQLENFCAAGLRCPWAHSKEEVLFHPHLFKTILCEEHRSQGDGQRSSRGARRGRCHRYYCPFAHGSQELRPSPLTAEQRDQCLKALEAFPVAECCEVCTPCAPPWVSSQCREMGDKGTPVLSFNPPTAGGAFRPPQEGDKGASVLSFNPPTAGGAFLPPQEVPSAIPSLSHLWGLPSGVPLSQGLLGTVRMEPSAVTYPLFSTPSDASLDPVDPWGNLGDVPVFVDIADNGVATVGPRQPAKAPLPLALKEMVYAML